jgi:hypothetical protein
MYAKYAKLNLGWLIMKVSHHLMIVTCHCEGQRWKLWGDINLKSKFWGRSIQVDPMGTLTLYFDDGEVFQWTKVFFYHNPHWSHSSKIENIHVITKYLWNCNSIIQLICSFPTILKLWHYAWQVTISICNLIWQVLCGSLWDYVYSR